MSKVLFDAARKKIQEKFSLEVSPGFSFHLGTMFAIPGKRPVGTIHAYSTEQLLNDAMDLVDDIRNHALDLDPDVIEGTYTVVEENVDGGQGETKAN